MVDIVRLLRADHFMTDTWENRNTEKLQNKAADEIERLRAMLADVETALVNFQIEVEP
jgi:hypothetical protein